MGDRPMILGERKLTVRLVTVRGYHRSYAASGPAGRL